MNERVQARRNALAEQIEQAQKAYQEIEDSLHRLDRSICAMAGGLQELDALLEDTTEPAAFEPAQAPV